MKNWLNLITSLIKKLAVRKKSHFEFFEMTDIGGRDYNEDRMAHFFHGDILLMVLADGLGGHKSGDIAAQLICQNIIQLAKQHKEALANDMEPLFKSIIQSAINKTRQIIKEQNIDSHTTLACAIVHRQQQKFMAAHVGDSRIYHLSHGEILWRSRDHSVVQMLVDDGELTEAEMGQHPEQGVLTRSISTKTIQPSFSKVKSIARNQILLLCSDGIWENLSPETIASLSNKANKNNIQKTLKQWLNSAKKCAAQACDNLTAQVLFFK